MSPKFEVGQAVRFSRKSQFDFWRHFGKRGRRKLFVRVIREREGQPQYGLRYITSEGREGQYLDCWFAESLLQERN